MSTKISIGFEFFRVQTISVYSTLMLCPEKFKSDAELNSYNKSRNKTSVFLWNSRVDAFRAPAYLYANFISKRHAFSDKVENIQTSPSLLKLPTLRPYQEAALSSWKLHSHRGVIALPTGSGKTILAIGALASLQVPALILVPTKVLLEQWEMVLREHFNEPVGIFGDGKRQVSSLTVSTFESAYRYMSQIGNRFKLLIVDEVHHFGNGIRDEALEMCTCPYRMGLTATNVTKDTIAAKLKELTGPTIYELSISELKGKYLSPFDLFSIQVNLSSDERLSYETSMKKFKEFYVPFLQRHPGSNWIDFIRFSQKSSEGRQAFSAWQHARQIICFPRAKEAMLKSLVKQHRSQKLLIFTPDTATAYQISRTHLIMPITSDIKRTERENALTKSPRKNPGFRLGSYRFLGQTRM